MLWIMSIVGTSVIFVSNRMKQSKRNMWSELKEEGTLFYSDECSEAYKMALKKVGRI